jgi:hypothetical protein
MSLIGDTRVWGLLLLIFSTGCATIMRQAVLQDMDANSRRQDPEASPEGMTDDWEPSVDCPPGLVQHEDCRVTPCKVTCEKPRDMGR